MDSSLQPANLLTVHRSAAQRLRTIPSVVGLLLLIAAVLKAHELLTEPALGTNFWASRVLLIAIVEFELALGLWLLAGLVPRLARCLCLGCFVAFLGTALYRAANGETSCGCFGTVIRVNPWYTAALDLAVVAALLSWRPGRRKPAVLAPRVLQRAGCWCVFLLLNVLGAIAMAAYRPILLSPEGYLIGAGDTVLLEPKEWVGNRLPLLKSIDMGDELTQGRWLLIVYRHDCPKCNKLISEIKELAPAVAENAATARVALLELPPYGKPLFYGGLRTSPYRYGRLSAAKSWHIGTPTILLLDEGIVAAAEVNTQHLPLTIDGLQREVWERYQ